MKARITMSYCYIKYNTILFIIALLYFTQIAIKYLYSFFTGMLVVALASVFR